MARYWAGGGPSDYTITTGDVVTVGAVTGRQALIVTGADVTWWNDETGGTRHLDLLDSNGVSVSSVLSSDGSDGRALGQIPRVQYPEGVTGAWASADGGPRVWMPADVSALASQTAAQAGQTAADLTAHLSAPNPHAMASNDLTDFSDETPADGQVPFYRTAEGRYVPTTVEGLDPTDFVSAHGGSEVVIPTGDVTTRVLGVRLPPGDRSAAVNTYEVWWNAGSEAVPNWVLVTRINPYGELRGRASRADRVYGQVAQATGQTANLWEFTDPAGVPLSWVDAAGRVRAPNVGITPTWNQDAAATGTGTYRWYNPTGGPLILRGFIVSAGGTAPAGGDFIINPKLDGVAVYASANRPKITAGNRTSGLVTNMATTIWPAGSYLTVDVDSVPTTAPTKITIQAVAY